MNVQMYSPIDKPATLRPETRTFGHRWAVIGKILMCTFISAFVMSDLFLRWELSQIEHALRRMELRIQDLENGAIVDVNQELVPDEEEVRLKRTKRGIGSPTTDPSPNSEGSEASSTGSRKGNRKNKSAVGHFVASIDRDRLARQQAGGHTNIIGNFTDKGFLPYDNIYRIWQPSNWTDKKAFKYDENTGKVKVKQAGNYIIYSQVMFHGPSARKSYGIHVNDELTPVVEAISFEMLAESRQKRSAATLFHPSEQGASEIITDRMERTAADDVMTDASVDGGESRTKRSVNSHDSYNQCNTFVVMTLNKNDKVFLRSLERWRTIIPQRSLTFWGLAKL